MGKPVKRINVWGGWSQGNNWALSAKIMILRGNEQKDEQGQPTLAPRYTTFLLSFELFQPWVFISIKLNKFSDTGGFEPAIDSAYEEKHEAPAQATGANPTP
jgi:hypothetical protein